MAGSMKLDSDIKQNIKISIISTFAYPGSLLTLGRLSVGGCCGVLQIGLSSADLRQWQRFRGSGEGTIKELSSFFLLVVAASPPGSEIARFPCFFNPWFLAGPYW